MYYYLDIFQVRIQNFLEKAKNYWRKENVADNEERLSKEKEMLRRNIIGLIKTRRLSKAQRLLVKEEFKPWSRDTQAKVCGSWHLLFFKVVNGLDFLF